MDSSQVIIVGAGASGLAAAYHLRSQGLKPVILEASNRVGGRIFTTRPDGTGLPVELGAEFVHGEPDISLGLLRAGGLPFTEWAGKFMMGEKGKIVESSAMWTEVEKLNKKLRVPKTGDVSWLEAAKKHEKRSPKAVKYGVSFIQGFHGADPDVISLESLKNAESSEQGSTSFRILSGYDSLLSLLQSKEQEILFRHRVTKVSWRRGNVVIEAEAEGKIKRLECESILLTVPISILPEIQFEPALPEKEKALSLLATGYASRVTLDFEESFWDPKMSLVTSPGIFFPTWWTMEPVRTRRIVAWTGHDRTLELAEKSDSEVMDLVLESATEVFGVSKKRLAASLLRADYHNWTKDPYIKGAYSYVRKGGVSAQKKLGRPIEDTLFFAGEACHHRGNHATVDGALETGLWAAKNIIQTRS